MPIRQFRLRDDYGNSQFGGGGGGVSVLTPNPRGIMDFDGVSDYLERDGGFTGVSDSGNFFFSMFGKLTGGDGSWMGIVGDSGANYVYIARSAINLIQIHFQGYLGAIWINGTVGPTVSSGWWHLAVSASLGTATQKIQIRFNDVEISTPPFLGTWNPSGDVINYTSAFNWLVGSILPSGDRFQGMMSEIYMNMGGAFIDLDITANRRKFLRSNGTPAVLGATGEKPTGTPPTLYLSTTSGGTTADFRTNKGSGGGMFEVGVLTSVVDNIVVPMP